MGWLIYPLYDYIIMQNYKEISYAVCWDKLTLLIWLENKWKSIETNKLTWVNKTTLITGCRWFGGSPNCVLLFTAQKGHHRTFGRWMSETFDRHARAMSRVAGWRGRLSQKEVGSWSACSACIEIPGVLELLEIGRSYHVF